MGIQTQIDRLTNVRESIKEAIASKDVNVPTNAKLDECAEYISKIEAKHADTVDGWHVEVITKGSTPSTVPNSICFEYAGG